MGTTSTIEYKDHDDQEEATAQTSQEHHCMPPFVTMTTKCGSTKKLAFCLFRYAQPPKNSLFWQPQPQHTHTHTHTHIPPTVSKKHHTSHTQVTCPPPQKDRPESGGNAVGQRYSRPKRIVDIGVRYPPPN